MTKDQLIDKLREIRTAVELDEEQFSLEFAENFIEKIDGAIHQLEGVK